MIPKIVAVPITADDDGWSFFDSTESCVVDAAVLCPRDLRRREGLGPLE